MTKKKAHIEVQHPDGTVEYPDLPKSMAVTDEQLDAWKKAPKEQALKEALELFKLQGIDVTEARFKLDVLRFISDLQGASAPTTQGGAVIQIFVNQPSEPRRVVTVTPSPEPESAEKKEDAPP